MKNTQIKQDHVKAQNKHNALNATK